MSLQDVEAFWAKVCFDGEFQPEGKFSTYRELIVGSMLDVLQSIAPVANEILSEGEWRQLLWEFLKAKPPQSFSVRDLPYEFAHFLQSNSYSLSESYPYLGDLIEYECLEVVVRFAPEVEISTGAKMLHLNSAHALRRYPWPVHVISKENSDPALLPQGEYFLFLWRDPEAIDEVKFMEVNPLVASLITHLETEAKSAEQVLKLVALEHEIPWSDDFFEEGKALLENMQMQGIILTSTPQA